MAVVNTAVDEEKMADEPAGIEMEEMETLMTSKEESKGGVLAITNEGLVKHYTIFLHF